MNITSDELRAVAAKLHARDMRTTRGLQWAHGGAKALESAADTIDALTRELTEAASGDDRLEREQAARIEGLETALRQIANIDCESDHDHSGSPCPKRIAIEAL